MSLKSKPRLGRGLSSLISVSDLPVEREIPSLPEVPLAAPKKAIASAAATQSPPESVTNQVNDIRLDQIRPNPHQPRRKMNEVSIAELAASFKTSGIIQPIVVRREGNHYELIAGERRWRAAALAGLPNIPAIIRDVDRLTQAQMALVENVQRENLNPIDRAMAYQTLTRQLGLTQAELAARVGEERSTIANYLRLLDLPESIQTSVSEGRINHGHAKLLAGVADRAEQEGLANLVVAQELSVRNLERMIQAGALPTVERDTPAGRSAHIQDLEKSLSRQLGMRIQVRAAGQSKSKGRLVIHYANLDQFDDLLSRLGVAAE